MLTKNDKIKFVENGRKEITKYKTIGIVSVNSIPDKLLQSARNKLKENLKVIIGRKKLIQKILESNEKTKQLIERIDGTSVIILSNNTPSELYGLLKINAIGLSAKPKQIAKDDIFVPKQETMLKPGQAVTELKKAGLDVQMQKGKVIIGTDKVIVSKGEVVSKEVANALHTLGITPFTAFLEPKLLLNEGLVYTTEIMAIDSNSVKMDLGKAFSSALQIALKLEMPNPYTISRMISEHYLRAVVLGKEAKLSDTGIVENPASKAPDGANALTPDDTKI